MRTALIAFALASLCFGGARLLETRQSEFLPFPLPPPGRTVQTIATVAAAAKHELWVDVAERRTGLALANDGPPLPCEIEIRLITPPESRLLSRSFLKIAADAPGNIRTYASPEFDLPAGLHEIEVANAGCQPTNSFVGGKAYLTHPAPVTVPASLLLLGIAYLATCIGAVAAALTALQHMRRKHA